MESVCPAGFSVLTEHAIWPRSVLEHFHSTHPRLKNTVVSSTFSLCFQLATCFYSPGSGLSPKVTFPERTSLTPFHTATPGPHGSAHLEQASSRLLPPPSTPTLHFIFLQILITLSIPNVYLFTVCKLQGRGDYFVLLLYPQDLEHDPVVKVCNDCRGKGERRGKQRK